MVDVEHHSGEDEAMKNFGQSDDSVIREDELMSDPNAKEKDEMMTKSKEEEDSKEDWA